MPEHIANPSRTAAVLKRHGFTFKKSLGQNFFDQPHDFAKHCRRCQPHPS